MEIIVRPMQFSHQGHIWTKIIIFIYFQIGYILTLLITDFSILSKSKYLDICLLFYYYY